MTGDVSKKGIASILVRATIFYLLVSFAFRLMSHGLGGVLPAMVCIVIAATVGAPSVVDLITGTGENAFLGSNKWRGATLHEPSPELVERLRLLISHGELERVEQQLQELLEIYPKNAAIHHLRMHIMARQGIAPSSLLREADVRLDKNEGGKLTRLLASDPLPEWVGPQPPDGLENLPSGDPNGG